MPVIQVDPLHPLLHRRELSGIRRPQIADLIDRNAVTVAPNNMDNREVDPIFGAPVEHATWREMIERADRLRFEETVREREYRVGEPVLETDPPSQPATQYEHPTRNTTLEDSIPLEPEFVGESVRDKILFLRFEYRDNSDNAHTIQTETEYIDTPWTRRDVWNRILEIIRGLGNKGHQSVQLTDIKLI